MNYICFYILQKYHLIFSNGISESKQLINSEFLTNVDINDYQLHSQPTKSACGGVATYVKKSLDHKVLKRLNVLEEEFETLCIKINTDPKSKNIVICCVYRHPDTNASKFTVYLESTLSKIDKNKIICIMGDFSINLLNYEFHSDTNKFFNSVVSSSTPIFSSLLELLITQQL